MKSGNLNFLKHSGPLQTCMGNSLPFTVPSVQASWQQSSLSWSKQYKELLAIVHTADHTVW